mgnify:CR=1 FL=1
MTLLIDNYDSFSYNLYQLIGQFDKNIKVIRNDEYKAEDFKEIEKLNPNIIIISPGPGKPEDAGICIDIIKYFYINKDNKSKISNPICPNILNFKLFKSKIKLKVKINNIILI